MAGDVCAMLQSLFGELRMRHERVEALAKKHEGYLGKAASFERGSRMNREWAKLALGNMKSIKGEIELVNACSAKIMRVLDGM